MYLHSAHYRVIRRMLSISIDGNKKEVVDYAGSTEGMPAIITDLERSVDTLAQTQRWVEETPPVTDLLNFSSSIVSIT